MTDAAPQKTARPLKPAELASQLRQAARESGVQSGDPLGPLVEVFAKLLVWLGRWQAYFEARASAAVHRIETEADKSAAKLAAVTASRSEATENDIQLAATRAAEMTAQAVLKAAPQRARSILVLSVASAFGLGGAIGYGCAAKSSTETLTAVAALQGALLGRPDELGFWTHVIQRNTVTGILNSCAQPGRMTVTATSRVCLAPIRIDGPPDSHP